MSAKPAPQRLSIVSASTVPDTDSPRSTPSKAMSTPRTPWSPEVAAFVPARPATHTNSRVYVSQDYQAAQEQRQRVHQAQTEWRQHDHSFKSLINSRHPGLHRVCPKLTKLPYHWSALLAALQVQDCFCKNIQGTTPCQQHGWRYAWAWLAVGGSWRNNEQEYRPRIAEVLTRPLDPVIFHQWITTMPCSCEAVEPAWERYLEEEWQKLFMAGNLVEQTPLAVEYLRGIWQWALRYPDYHQLASMAQGVNFIRWLHQFQPTLFEPPERNQISKRFRNPTQFNYWVQSEYCYCNEWRKQWQRLFRMVEDADNPIIPRTEADLLHFVNEQKAMHDAAREARTKNKLAKEVRRQKGQQLDIAPAFNNHIFDLPKDDHNFVPDCRNICLICRSRTIKRSPVLDRSTMWCPGRDESGMELDSYDEVPGDRLLASTWPNPTEYDYEGTMRCSTEGGMFGRALPLVGKSDVTGTRRPIPSAEQKPSDQTNPSNYQNLPWLLPLDLDRPSWPLDRYVWQAASFMVSSFDFNDVCRYCMKIPNQQHALFDGGYRCQLCSDLKMPHEDIEEEEGLVWPSLEVGLWAALNNPDLLELDDAGLADDAACERWKLLDLFGQNHA